jgi:alpha-methylacyl-CoA racemase
MILIILVILVIYREGFSFNKVIFNTFKLIYEGVLSTLSRKNEKPYAPINLLADFAGGGLMCALAIMSSLYERDVGKNQPENGGKVIDLAMVEGSAYLSSWLWSSRNIPGVWAGASRGDNLLDGGHAAYETYETKDEKFIACGSLEPEFYSNLLKGLGLENETKDVDKELLTQKFKKKTLEEWMSIYKDLDACISPVLTLDEAVNYRHNAERNSFVKIPDGSHMPTMNWLQDMDPAKRSFNMPKIGQHTTCILKEFGYSDQQISDFEKQRAVELFNGTKKKKSKL